MSAPTPGPWEVFWIESSAGTSARICNADGNDVAYIPMSWNARGDAPLLAAAPALADALAAAFRDFAYESTQPEFDRERRLAVWRQMRVALRAAGRLP